MQPSVEGPEGSRDLRVSWPPVFHSFCISTDRLSKMPFSWRTTPLLALSFRSVASTSCYYPDGSLATDYDYVPCGTSGDSACCIPNEGDKCLSNGLCLFTSDYIYRGACSSSPQRVVDLG